MEHAAQGIAEPALGNSPTEIGEKQPHEQATPAIVVDRAAIIEHTDGDEVDASIDVVYGDGLGELLPSELRHLPISWRAAA